MGTYRIAAIGSAITTARFSEVLRPLTVTVGTLVMPRRRAASSRSGLINQDWIGPEPPNTLHQAGNLAFRMPPRVVWKFLQFADRTPDHTLHDAARPAAGGILPSQQSQDATSWRLVRCLMTRSERLLMRATMELRGAAELSEPVRLGPNRIASDQN